MSVNTISKIGFIVSMVIIVILALALQYSLEHLSVRPDTRPLHSSKECADLQEAWLSLPIRAWKASNDLPTLSAQVRHLCK